jgi:cell division protein FtsB
MPVDLTLIRASIEGSGNTPSTPRGWNDRANLGALCDEVEALRRQVAELQAEVDAARGAARLRAYLRDPDAAPDEVEP